MAVFTFAILVSALYRYHQDFVIGIVDNVLEQVTLGLEQNDFKFNQKRIAEIKYLGELYKDHLAIFGIRCTALSPLVMKVVPQRLERLVCWTLPDDYFRLRLACTL